MPIYMKYDGIDGDVTAQGHEKWIECNSFQFGIGRGITNATGRGTNRNASTPSVSEIVVTKVLDDSSTNLFRAALFGEGKLVKFDLGKSDKDAFEAYALYELTDTLVSGYSVSSGGDRPSESISLNFTKIQYKNVVMGGKNETGDPDIAIWDLAKGTGS